MRCNACDGLGYIDTPNVLPMRTTCENCEGCGVEPTPEGMAIAVAALRKIARNEHDDTPEHLAQIALGDIE